MSDLSFFWITVGLAGVSLVLTYVLFKFLDSRAVAKGKLLGGTIRYGGALAGFVLLFTLLFSAFYRLRGDPGVTTPINLAGEWKMALHTSHGNVELGRAVIRQRKHDPVLEISGEVSGRKDPVGTTFASLFGVIRGRSVYLFYENRDGERGLIHGAIIDDKPRVLTLTYNDLAGFDRNEDPAGTIVLTRL
jgi:hypothetical protein